MFWCSLVLPVVSDMIGQGWLIYMRGLICCDCLHLRLLITKGTHLTVRMGILTRKCFNVVFVFSFQNRVMVLKHLKKDRTLGCKIPQDGPNREEIQPLHQPGSCLCKTTRLYSSSHQKCQLFSFWVSGNN